MSCSGFEDRLVAALASGSEPERDAHAASCARCGVLVDDLPAIAAALRTLRAPDPSPALARRLLEAPADLASRAEAHAAVSLLDGALRAPDPSPELLARLAFLPTRARASRPAGTAGRLRRSAAAFFADWKLTVFSAYAMALVLVFVLRVDPISFARGTAEGLTTAGGKAVAEAREAAERRLGEARLTSRFDYRAYRLVAAGRARAVAYSQLLVERLFGDVEVRAADREPKGGNLRS